MAFSMGGSREQSEINVTPLIDVLLVLLIIFMVIVPVTPRGLASEVPQGTPAGEPGVSPLTVRVGEDADGASVVYAVDGRAVKRERLGAAIATELRLRANRSVWIEASPQLSYQRVVEVVSESQAAGASAIGLAKVR